MDNKFKPVYGGPLLQSLVQQRACAQHMEDHLAMLAWLYPDCDVRIVHGDEIVLVAKNENSDLKEIGERVHAGAEGMFDAIAAHEQRELQRWQSYADGWKSGLPALLDFALNPRVKAVHDFWLGPPLEPRMLKTKKGPRRYRVQMVRV